MPIDISPRKLQESVDIGFKRTERTRKARLSFIRQFVGQYYDATEGDIGKEPMNLIYNAIRVLVPNLVFNYPTFKSETDYLAYREYAELQGLMLTQDAKRMKLRDKYRRGVVDALFLMGTLKTGLCSSGSAVHFEEDDATDPGMIYTDVVDFDNFVWDPTSRSIEESLYRGDRMVVPRVALLDSGLYDNALIEKLPPAFSNHRRNDRVESISTGGINMEEAGRIEDLVEIVELWVPRAKALITIPGSSDVQFDDYLRATDYYGPDSGPYSHLILTPPVPGNPLPISSVGIWSDLHHAANRMAVKIIDQADRQKDVLAYKPSAADDAREVQDASDGDAIAVDDPSAMNTLSFGGQKNSNESHLASLQMWFNMMSGNTEGLAGLSMNAGSATEANHLASNSAITLTDMQDLVYNWVAEEGQKRLWFRHTDPLLETPLTVKRNLTPPGSLIDLGPTEVQVILTPEARRGDFLNFAISVEPESMGREDSNARYQKALEFAVKIIPAAAQATMTCMQMGIPFSFPKFVTRMAEQAGIKWVDEVFQDPQLQMTLMQRMMMGPRVADSKGQVAPMGGGLGGIMQNGGSPMAGRVDGQDTQDRQSAQMGAANGPGQMMNREV